MATPDSAERYDVVCSFESDEEGGREGGREARGREGESERVSE